MRSTPESDAPTVSRAHDRVLARWFWNGYARRWIPWLLLGALCMVIDGAMTGVLSALLKPMFDDVLVAGRADMVLWVALAFGATFVVRAITSFTYRTVMAYVSEKVVTGLQSKLTSHLMTLDQGFHHTHPPGHLIDRVRGDTVEVAAIFDRLIPGVARDSISILALLAVALWTDWLWTVVALVGVPLLVLPAAILQRAVRKMGIRARDASAAASTRLDEIFHGVVTIQRAGLEEQETTRLSQVLSRFVKARVRVAGGQAAMGSMSDLVAALGFALVLVLAGGQIVAGERTVGEFMTFFSAIAFLFDPLRRLGALAGTWQNVLASLERIYRLLNEKPRIAQPEGPLDPLPAPGTEEIRFDDVTFAYDGEPVLRGLSFTAEPGKTTALVGPSGAGKTTVFTLVTRLADAQAGRVSVGGADVTRTDLRGLRDLFSVVAQDSALFDETLRDNVLMGASDVSEARLAEALSAAHVDEFLPSLSDGLDTRVGPRGSALSGGQRQRVTIARALLRESPILLLDEATSALDARSEALVQQALDKLSANRTTLVIAHRLSTIRHADKIVVMEAGRVVEEGDHETLLANGGTYARLYALQFKD
ncbi:ABC transporter ATP-binding protein [Pararhodobacter zhoushanensis]|uniref:ABC transporter ATP-binding protein n=1 Tax=Pararhodobacter zhoushanensis TaxID=2479545 RepID=UPI000F8D35D3|nr:ABC transporter ATP-binding protein [Pararhodobacter zhoushanensis]